MMIGIVMGSGRLEANMKLLLHGVTTGAELTSLYKRAFDASEELYVLSAYLTEWDSSLRLNSHCQRFLMIIGKDFGITRKAACKKVMTWLPAKYKSHFMVADRVPGFHPKAAFWKESSRRFFAIVGSSNLTRAAFDTNYEANLYCQLSSLDYRRAKRWINEIRKDSLPISDDWLKKYKEAPSGSRPRAKRKDQGNLGAVAAFPLPTPKKTNAWIVKRRRALVRYRKHEKGLMELFRKCASREVPSEGFYARLPDYWSYELNDRLQGPGFERTAKNSDFQELSKSFVKIIDADSEDRDDVVAEEIDRLAAEEVPTRAAFLSEMLCLKFPTLYPVLNKPVKSYLVAIAFRPPRGASEGARYVDLAQKLRHSLLQNPDHLAKNLAELDIVIWLKYGHT